MNPALRNTSARRDSPAGLFYGADATVHFGYARAFVAAYPAVRIHPERLLVISGQREELVSSGASMSWHDLVLYLIARYAGATAAQWVARLFALQWHQDGLAPYIVFEGQRGHGDAEIQSAQQWLETHFSVASPVQEMIGRSRLAERTFKRRFAGATGLTPLGYVQRLRVEDAKHRAIEVNRGLVLVRRDLHCDISTGRELSLFGHVYVILQAASSQPSTFAERVRQIPSQAT